MDHCGMQCWAEPCGSLARARKQGLNRKTNAVGQRFACSRAAFTADMLSSAVWAANTPRIAAPCVAGNAAYRRQRISTHWSSVKIPNWIVPCVRRQFAGAHGSTCAQRTDAVPMALNSVLAAAVFLWCFSQWLASRGGVGYETSR